MTTAETLPRTRAEALAVGSKLFFSGKPCKRGHLSPKYTQTWNCFECRKQSNAAMDPERGRLRASTYRAANLEKVRQAHAAWKTANPGAHLESSSASDAGPACPAWSDRDACRAVYAACPPGWDVDHVIPLRGTTVSGLHVPANLRCLPRSANRSKRDDFNPDDPDHLESAFKALGVILPRRLFVPAGLLVG